MFAALRKHKEVVKSYPREGAGLEAFVDASDTGYTRNAQPIEGGVAVKNIASKSLINDDVEQPGSEIESRKDSPLQNETVAGKLESVVNGKTNGVTNGVH